VSRFGPLAQNMLVALKHAVAWADGYVAAGNEAPPWLEEARAAIRKAEAK